MAKQTYHAVNIIRVGVAGEEDKVFMPGDEVTGLSVDHMKELWNAGSLEARDAAASQAADEKDAEIANLREQIAALEAEKAAAAAAQVPSEPSDADSGAATDTEDGESEPPADPEAPAV